MAIALCISAYNSAWCLPRLLQSAHAQTIAFDEIWVYDDASTDETTSVAQQYGAQVVLGESNRGPGYGRNQLASNIRSEWIHFHDADDLLMPNFVESAQPWLQNLSVDIVLFSYHERDEESGVTIATRVFDDQELRRDPCSYTIREQINPFAGLYRKSAFLLAGGFDEDPSNLYSRYSEDIEFHIRLAFAGFKFAAAPEIATINFRRSTSTSQINGLKCVQALVAIMEQTALRYDSKRYYVEIANKLWGAAALLAAYLDWPTADHAVRLALTLAPVEAVKLSTFFRSLCRVSPEAALRFREGLVRTFKPSLRQSFPQ